MAEVAIRASARWSLQHINESAWNGGFTDYLCGRLGVTADLRGYYGTAFITPNPYNIFKPSISQYSFMAGPQYRIVSREHWAISGQALVGGAKGNFNAAALGFLRARSSDYGANGTKFSLRLGVPVDYNLGPGLAVAHTARLLVHDFRGHGAGEEHWVQCGHRLSVSAASKSLDRDAWDL